MNNKFILESMSMDLKRVSLGNYRKSYHMAARFYEETLKRKKELDTSSLKGYLLVILEKIEYMKNQNADEVSENALMYSTLIQNYTQTFF